MLSKIISGTLEGIEINKVIVESDLSYGLPVFTLVGLADLTVKESKERIRSALINSGYSLPDDKITVNLSPADTKKIGSHFDLAITMGILFAKRKLEERKYNDFCFLGELSLDGNLIENDNLFALIIGLREMGIKKFFIPKSFIKTLSVITDTYFYPAKNLEEVCNHFFKDEKITPIYNETCEIKNNPEEVLDFADVYGQEEAKRAIEIAVAGRHNIAMIGSPGTGKSMLSKRVPYIMPDLTYDEMIEITKIYSIADELKSVGSLITKRPFRNPHHSASHTALLGGGAKARPGEITLAHNGVLFLDELTEFSKYTLDNLREPLETGDISISRAGAKNKYPAAFMLVSAMNPCPCGYYGHPKKHCICSETARLKYMSKVSGPLLDRIDIKLNIAHIDYKKIGNGVGGKSSKDMKEKINIALKFQEKRYKNLNFKYNSKIPDSRIKKICHLDNEINKILEMAYDKYSFSARGINKILKVARTIADMDESENIRKSDVLEAINYRV
ncbi:MAG: YifB family Mg chelatase-like AAA ATPase [Clostridiales Family XIII bacterium]|jgi:magnesium chelatase family protein|nr:YifB family Mg chelatase-like AAA ATPase [Clostridiales Family XIII bacterium]